MKTKTLLFSVLLLSCGSLSAQWLGNLNDLYWNDNVGIGPVFNNGMGPEEDQPPTQTLDVDGTVRIRSLSLVTQQNDALTRILVANNNGDLYWRDAPSITQNIFASFPDSAGDAGGNTNAYFGHEAGINTTGGNNTFIGYQSGFNTSTGYENSALGSLSMSTNTVGIRNIAIGAYSLSTNSQGSQNTALGHAALGYNDTGNNNVAVGSGTGLSNSTGSGNVFLGYEAGYNETGSNRLYIANSSTDTPLIWGDFQNNLLNFNGNVGIGTTIPNSKLTVNGQIKSLNGGIFSSSSAGGDHAFVSNHTDGVFSDWLDTGDNATAFNLIGNENEHAGFGVALGPNIVSPIIWMYANPDKNALRVRTMDYTGDMTSGSDLLVVRSNGNVGIGTNSPQYKLDVRGWISSGGSDFVLGQHDGRGQGQVKFGNRALVHGWIEDELIINYNGDFEGGVIVHGTKLHVDGNASKPGGGSWTNSGSDRRLKQDITPFTDGLEQIQQIKPVWYRYNGLASFPTDEQYVGIIAQEMREVAPYTVGSFTYEDEDGKSTEYLNYNGSAVTYMLVNAIKEQQQQIEAQQQENEQLKERIEALENLMNNAGETTEIKDGSTQSKSNLSNGFTLYQNAPNPFNKTTTIEAVVPEGVQQAKIIVYNLQGLELKSYDLNQRGKVAVEISAGHFPSGMYLYTLFADGQLIDTKKMILTR